MRNALLLAASGSGGGAANAPRLDCATALGTSTEVSKMIGVLVLTGAGGR